MSERTTTSGNATRESAAGFAAGTDGGPVEDLSNSDPDRPKSEFDKKHGNYQLSEQEEWAREYLDKHLDLFGSRDDEADDVTKNLIDKRRDLAEASVKARSGGLLYSKRNRRGNLILAQESYEEARQALYEETLEQLDSDDEEKKDRTPKKNRTLKYKSALLAELKAREDGALMGEEASYYLSKKDSWLQKNVVERYKGLSKKQRLAVNIGGAAVAGLLTFGAAGLVGAGAAAGAAGGRLARGYWSREASRDGAVQTTKEKQQESTLRTSNHADYVESHEDLTSNLKRHNKASTVASKQTKDHLKREDEKFRDATDKAAETSREKRKSLGKSTVWVLGGAAVGAAVGAALENSNWRGWFRGGADPEAPGPNGVSPEIEDPEVQEQLDDMQDSIDGLEDKVDELTEENEALVQENEALREDLAEAEERIDELESDSVEPESEPDPESEISERSAYLYGEFAGTEVSIDIPKGSNIWNQLECAIEQQDPNISYHEKQRLVGNMLHVMEHEFPGRDLDLVYPGETFSFKLPARA